MKVLDLRCGDQHCFEGWFGSEEDFQNQLGRGLIECPLCADKTIQKMPSAPRLNLGHAAPHPASAEPCVPGSAAADSVAVPKNTPKAQPATGNLPDLRDVREARGLRESPDGLPAAAQAAFLKAVRQVLAHTEDVGQRFADEARRMHYGEAETRSIRGQASAREAVDLLEEGIEVMPLPMLPLLKETLQ